MSIVSGPRRSLTSVDDMPTLILSALADRFLALVIVGTFRVLDLKPSVDFIRFLVVIECGDVCVVKGAEHTRGFGEETVLGNVIFSCACFLLLKEKALCVNDFLPIILSCTFFGEDSFVKFFIEGEGRLPLYRSIKLSDYTRSSSDHRRARFLEASSCCDALGALRNGTPLLELPYFDGTGEACGVIGVDSLVMERSNTLSWSSSELEEL